MALLEGVALLEYVCPFWRKCVTVQVAFEVSYMLKLRSVGQLLPLPTDQDVELPTSSPAPCLPACHNEDEGLNLRNCMPAQLNVFFIRVALVMVCSLQQEKP